MVTSATDGPRPVFVYGTLRPGAENWEPFLAGRAVHDEPGRLPGHVLFELEYPVVVEHTSAPAGAGEPPVVIGHSVHVAPDHHDRLLERLDWLEGHLPHDPGRSLYVRVRRDVERAGGEPVECWVYLAGPELQARVVGREPVPGGDWLAARDPAWTDPDLPLVGPDPDGLR